jgi:hypothetical protein
MAAKLPTIRPTEKRESRCCVFRRGMQLPQNQILLTFAGLETDQAGLAAVHASQRGELRRAQTADAMPTKHRLRKCLLCVARAAAHGVSGAKRKSHRYRHVSTQPSALDRIVTLTRLTHTMQVLRLLGDAYGRTHTTSTPVKCA